MAGTKAGEESCPLKTPSPEPARPRKKQADKTQQGSRSKTMANCKLLSLIKVIFLTATDANHRHWDFSPETCIILCSITPESYLAPAHCVPKGMHSCLTLQHILLPLSCLCSQRLATQFSGLNITKICQHPLTEYTPVPIPRSNVILEIRREFWLGRRPAGSGLRVPGRALESGAGGGGGGKHGMPAVLTCSSPLGDGYGKWNLVLHLGRLIFRTSARFH